MVITGEGKFFSAGADINAFQESIEANEAPQLIRDLTNILHPLLMRIRESSTIVVAAINGAAAGGGLGLALACDARIASPKAKLAASYASIGLSPDGGTTWLFLDLLVNNEVANSSSRTKSGMQKNQPTQEPSMKSSMKTNSSTDPSKLQPIGVNGATTSEKQPNISFTSKHSTISKPISSMSRP